MYYYFKLSNLCARIGHWQKTVQVQGSAASAAAHPSPESLSLGQLHTPSVVLLPGSPSRTSRRSISPIRRVRASVKSESRHQLRLLMQAAASQPERCPSPHLIGELPAAP
eukprot:2550294-Rhodomonas_salina.1